MRDCLLVDHRPHCRFEVTNEPALPLIEALIAEGACGLVSLMDHTPGQGQFPTSESYRRYYQKRYGHDEKYVDVALAEKMEGARRSIERIHRLAERTRAAGLPLASHDDDHADRVELMREVGATISEFPLNLAAAATARARGLRTVFVPRAERFSRRQPGSWHPGDRRHRRRPCRRPGQRLPAGQHGVGSFSRCRRLRLSPSPGCEVGHRESGRGRGLG